MKYALLLGLLTLTTLAYSPVFSAGYVYEDRNAFVDSVPGAAPDNRGPWLGWETERGQFQPAPRMLSNLTMRLQGWHLDSPLAFHAVNLAVHEMNAVLIWLILLSSGTVAAFVGTALWLLHPIQSEAVSYVSARPDVLAATAILTSLLVITRQSFTTQVLSRIKNVLIVTLAGLLALLAKESAIVVIGLFPLWLWFEGRWAKRWLIPLGVWSTAGALVAYRLLHVAAAEGAGQPWAAIRGYAAGPPHGPFWFAAVQAAAFWRMLALLVWPAGLTIDHDFDLVGPGLALVALVGLLGAAWGAWHVRHQWPTASFALAWLVVGLAPRFVMPLPDYMAERHLYVPLIGVWIAVGLGAQTFGDWLRGMGYFELGEVA